MAVSISYKVLMNIGPGGATVDIAPYVQSVTTSRGRSRPTEGCTPGTCSIIARNDDGRFDVISPGASYPTLDIKSIVQVAITIGGVDYPIFTGTIQNWGISIQGKQSIATFSCVDQFNKLSSVTLGSCVDITGAQPPTFPAQDCGARLLELISCEDASTGEPVFSGSYSLDTGVTPLGPKEATGNLLAEMQIVERTEAAVALFISRDGTLTFLDRHSKSSAGADITLSDSSFTGASDVHVDVSGITLTRDLGLLYNLVSAYRWDFSGELGGVPESAGAYQSQLWYGVRELTLSDVAITFEPGGDVIAQGLANYLLSVYKNASISIGSIKVKPLNVNSRTNLNDTQRNAQLASLAQLDIGDVAEVKFNNNWTAWSNDNEVMIDKIDHSLAPAWWEVTIQASGSTGNARTRQYLELDNGTFGILRTHSTTTLTAVRDGHVISAFPTNVYGSGTTFDVLWASTVGSNYMEELGTWGYVTFDLSGLSGQSIGQANLLLTLSNLSLTPYPRVFATNSHYDESTTNWNNSPDLGYMIWEFNKVVSQPALSAGTEISIPVTSWARECIGGLMTLALLGPRYSTNQLSFHSRTSATAGYRPRLSVGYDNHSYTLAP